MSPSPLFLSNLYRPTGDGGKIEILNGELPHPQEGVGGQFDSFNKCFSDILWIFKFYRSLPLRI